LPSGLPHQNAVCTSSVTHTCYMPLPSHSSWFRHPNNVCWEVLCTLLRSPIICSLSDLSTLLLSVILSLWPPQCLTKFGHSALRNVRVLFSKWHRAI
jgi:hypothetical protein